MLDKARYYGFSQADNSIRDPHDDILHCAIVAILIYTASLGCVLGILSEFDIKVNYVPIALTLLLASFFLSFIHLSRLLYVFGYFAFLFVYSYALMSLRSYANSGYQALLNIVNSTYSDHYMLTAVREYEEIISDRYTTITCVAVFIGLFLVLLLNVGIFNDMFFLTTFNLTFWPLQLGIFIGRYPSYLSLTLLFFAYFGVYFLRHSGHYFFVQPPFGKRPREYFFDYDDDAGRHMIFHKSNARGMLSLCAFALAISLIFSLFVSSVVSTSEQEALTNRSALKVQMDENVKILTQNGIAGMFNRYSAKGGLSGGRLGGVRSVSPDYETDLKVTFVPHSVEPMYLKGFVGQHYSRDRWSRPSRSTGYGLIMPRAEGPVSQEQTARERVLAPAETYERLMQKGYLSDHTAKITVENVDADTSYTYTPYFLSAIPGNGTVDAYSTLSGYSAIDHSETYEYIPYTSSEMPLLFDKLREFELYSESEQLPLSEYDAEVFSNYLQIPDSIRDELMSYHDEIGTSQTVQGQIGLIYSFFLKNYTYDFAPGATPHRYDFVTYFLGEQKRGYCSHFASAATMLLRSYGIPARYVEGYVISLSSITETAERVDSDVSAYYTGENPLGESAVITAEISDGNAHAWTEVYIPSFGWFPVDLTVPATEESVPAYGDFLSSLARLFRPTGSAEEAEVTQTDEVTSEHVRSGPFDLNGIPVFLIFIAALAILMLIPLLKRGFIELKAFIRRRRLYLAGDPSETVRYGFLRARRHLARMYKDSAPSLVDDTFVLIKRLAYSATRSSKRLNAMLTGSDLSLDDIRLLTQECFYGEKNISRSEADLLIKFYKKI